MASATQPAPAAPTTRDGAPAGTGLLLVEGIAGRDLVLAGSSASDVWVEASLGRGRDAAPDDHADRIECTEPLNLMDVDDVLTLQWHRHFAFEDHAGATELVLRVVTAAHGTGEGRRVAAVGRVAVPLEARVTQLAASVPLSCDLWPASGARGPETEAGADGDATSGGEEKAGDAAENSRTCGRLRISIRCLPSVSGIVRAEVMSAGPVKCVPRCSHVLRCCGQPSHDRVHVLARVPCVPVLPCRRQPRTGVQLQCPDRLRVSVGIAGTTVRNGTNVSMGRDGCSLGASVGMFLPLDLLRGSAAIADHDGDGATDAPMVRVWVTLRDGSGMGVTLSALAPLAMVIGNAPTRHNSMLALVRSDAVGASAAPAVSAATGMPPSGPQLPLLLALQFMPAPMLSSSAQRSSEGGVAVAADASSAAAYTHVPAPATATVDAMRAIIALKRHFYVTDRKLSGLARGSTLASALDADEVVAPYVDGDGTDATELADLLRGSDVDLIPWRVYAGACTSVQLAASAASLEQAAWALDEAAQASTAPASVRLGPDGAAWARAGGHGRGNRKSSTSLARSTRRGLGSRGKGAGSDMQLDAAAALGASRTRLGATGATRRTRGVGGATGGTAVTAGATGRMRASSRTQASSAAWGGGSRRRGGRSHQRGRNSPTDAVAQALAAARANAAAGAPPATPTRADMSPVATRLAGGLGGSAPRPRLHHPTPPARHGPSTSVKTARRRRSLRPSNSAAPRPTTAPANTAQESLAKKLADAEADAAAARAEAEAARKEVAAALKRERSHREAMAKAVAASADEWAIGITATDVSDEDAVRRLCDKLAQYRMANESMRMRLHAAAGGENVMYGADEEEGMAGVAGRESRGHGQAQALDQEALEAELDAVVIPADATPQGAC